MQGNEIKIEPGTVVVTERFKVAGADVIVTQHYTPDEALRLSGELAAASVGARNMKSPGTVSAIKAAKG